MDKDYSDKSPNEEVPLELTKDMIERARKAGVNIWAIGEQLTKALEGQQGDRVNKVQKLLDVIKDIMLAYGVDSVQVGNVYCKNVDFGEGEGPTKSGYGNEEVTLGQTGLHIQTFPCSIQNAVYFLYEPMKIVFNLISELTKAAERNGRLMKGKEELQKELGLDIVKAMSDDG
jgi:hypothetical protein